RQVGPAAEPLLVALGQETKVGVDGRHEGVARVQHQGDAAGGEGTALTGDLPAELLGHLAVDVGEADAGLLADAALLPHTGPPAAAAGTLPGVLVEALAVQLFEAGDDAVLQAAEIGRGAFA